MRLRPTDLVRETRAFVHDLVLALTGGRWRRALFRLSLLAVVVAAAALAYAWSGFFSLSASSGHAALTYWFLDFGKHNVVETQSAGIDAPPLDDAALILKGAGHYATGCAPCHGAPGKPPAVIAARMTPEPPYLPAKLDRWEDEQLFWIVRHGIKFTGMPAWPALDRDDEIWAMVAFLRALEDLEPDEYERLAYGEDRERAVVDEHPPPNDLHALGMPLDSVLDNCARCHGADGLGRGAGAFPKLAGQREGYLLASLEAYANDARSSGIMQPVAADLDAETLRALAKHFATLPAGGRDTDADAAWVERGRTIATQGFLERGIPACVHCHGPGDEERNPVYPRLAGQYAGYLELQLRLFKERKRGGTHYAPIMYTVTRRMTPEDMRALAAYYASLSPSSE